MIFFLFGKMGGGVILAYVLVINFAECVDVMVLGFSFGPFFVYMESERYHFAA